MITIRTILCPVDFSDASQQALVHAAALASWYEAALTVQHVHAAALAPPAMAPGMGAIGAAALAAPAVDDAQLRRDLEEFAAVVPPVAGGITFRVASGPTAGGIVGEARATGADLIVLGTHGRSGFERLMLGSTTEKVLRTAPCPVLTVPPASAAPPAPRLFERILAATDFSAASNEAMEYALSLAQEANAHLTVLHVVEMPHMTGEWIPGATTDWKTLEAEVVAIAGQRLNDAVPASARDWCDLEERLERGRPYREILRVADADRAGLIVLGVHGHGTFERLFFGSTAQHVVRQARCPVLTVRAEA